MAHIAVSMVADGVRRLVAAWGETPGAAVGALGMRGLQIGSRSTRGSGDGHHRRAGTRARVRRLRRTRRLREGARADGLEPWRSGGPRPGDPRVKYPDPVQQFTGPGDPAFPHSAELRDQGLQPVRLHCPVGELADGDVNRPLVPAPAGARADGSELPGPVRKVFRLLSGTGPGPNRGVHLGPGHHQAGCQDVPPRYGCPAGPAAHVLTVSGHYMLDLCRPIRGPHKGGRSARYRGVERGGKGRRSTFWTQVRIPGGSGSIDPRPSRVSRPLHVLSETGESVVQLSVCGTEDAAGNGHLMEPGHGILLAPLRIA